ncbi:MAG: outer membrane beta-barrel protein [Verrucomicrobiae bacterium]|nr:outer membrane beta-barrel protein [Verrucomicrobiae bacterium]
MIKSLGKLALLVLVAAISTAVAEDVQVKQHNLAYGITLRGGYDSNIYTAEKDVTGSFYTTIQPDFHAAWSSPSTDITLHYTYAATYYEKRPERHWDQAHNFSFNLAHEFSPRLRVTLYEDFQPGFEPEIESGIRQRQGNYIQNRVAVSSSYILGGRWTLPVTMSHYFISYDEGEAAESLNRQSWDAKVGVKYNATSRTTFYSDFSHGVNTYEGYNRSYTSESLYFGVDHGLTPRLTVNASAGVQMLSFDVKSNQEFNPLLSLKANYSLTSRTAMNLSFSSQVQPTEVTQYLVQYSWILSGGIVHQFTPKLMASVNLSYIPAEYNTDMALSAKDLDYKLEPSSQGGTETTLSSTIAVAYQFNLNLRAELGWSYIDVSSHFANRTYSRHLTFLQGRLGF